MHRSTWKGCSRKFTFKILHSPGPIGPESPRSTPGHRTGPHYMLWCWIKMRVSGSAPVLCIKRCCDKVSSARGPRVGRTRPRESRFSGGPMVKSKATRGSRRKRGEASWLVVSRKAEAGRVGRKAEAGGHAPLLALVGDASSTPSKRPLSRRVAAGAPSEPPFTKSITKKSGDGAKSQTSAATRGAVRAPERLP
jgi:hypothetical protein